MKGTFLTLLLLIFFSSIGKTQSPKTKNSEPKSEFELNINGKKYKLGENEELTLDTLIKPKISIKLLENKIFDNSFIAFEYPRNLSYEFSQDVAYKNWALSGNTVVVMVFDLDVKTTISTLLDNMIEKFGKANCTTEDYQKTIGQRKLFGKKLHVSLAGQNLVVEFLEIKSSDSKSRYIYFQDSIENNQNSTEYEKVFNTINSTIIYK